MPHLELIEKIIDGSAAEAFLARNDRGLLVLERSRPALSKDIELYGRFLDAAKARQKLSHPHLVQLTEAGCDDDGRLFAVTEMLSGSHLGSLGELDADAALQFLIPLCEALSYLHQKGVVHGHLRPAHVFLAGPSGAPVPKLLDMGLLLFRSTKSLPVTQTLVAAEYLCPERVRGQRASPPSDIYGLGVLAHELICGRPPFSGRDDQTTRHLHLTAPVPPLPAGARWLQGWLDRCLEKDPAARYRDVDAARNGLIEASVGRITASPSLRPPPVPVPPPPREEESIYLGGVREALRNANAGLYGAIEPVALDRDEPPAPVEAPHSGLPPQTVTLRAPDEARTEPALEPVDPRQFGAYELLDLIGEGGMGQVWRARHVRLERTVAIKMLKPEMVSDDSSVARLMDEARAVNRVENPHIVKITDFVEEREQGRVWCVMEYLDGENLRALSRSQPLSIPRAVKIVRQVCEALAATHQVGVVHRDIKPDNIFVLQEPEPDFVKVLDFGVAKLRDERGVVNRTLVGEVVGTPAYMSPEQALGHTVDARSDLYSLGTVLYTLLDGQLPFEGKNVPTLVRNIVTEPPRPLPTHSCAGDPIGRGLEAVVMRCLEKDPAMRFPHMRALSAALLPFESARPILPVDEEDILSEDDDDDEETRLFPLRSASSRGRTRVIAIAVAVALLAGAGLRWAMSSTKAAAPAAELQKKSAKHR